ncbi:unnamed protein product, partial [Closterium sp. NIES-53]
DHFLSLDPTVLTVDFLEQHLLAAETSVVAIDAARGTPRTPFFEGCSPSPLAPSYAFADAVDVLGAEDVGAASASAKRRSRKGKGGRGGGGRSGGGGGGSSGGGGSGGGGSSGSGGGSGGFGGVSDGSGGGGGTGDSGSGGGRAGATQRGSSGGGQRQQQQRRSETPSTQQLREWFSQRGASGGSGSYPYVIHTAPHWLSWCWCRIYMRDTSGDKLSALAIPCVFLGFSLDPPGWQFYHPTSRRVFPSQDVTFDESVPFYRLFPYLSPLPHPRRSSLLEVPPPVDHLPPQGPAPSGVSQVDPLRGTAPVEKAVGSGAARGAAFGGNASGGVEPGGAESEGARSRGAEPRGAERGGAEPVGVEPGGAEPEGVELGGAESEGVESGGAEQPGTPSFGGPAGASPRLSPRSEPLSPQQLREGFAKRTRLLSGAAGACDSAARDPGAGGARVPTRAGGAEGATAVGLGGARTTDTGAAGTGGVGGARAKDPTKHGADGAGGARAVGAGAGGTCAGGA